MNTPHNPLPPADPQLAAWLDRSAQLSPEYGGGLSTHLPMALHALHALGAPPARLLALFDRVAPRVPARAGTEAQAPADWTALRGQFPAFEALHRHFDDIARHDGPGALLAQVLPDLLPGVSAAAFHGLIRTAHGVAAGHAGEVVTGLAYWAARHMPLPVADGCAAVALTPLPLGDWLAALQALPAPAGPPARRIATQMQAWAGVPGFSTVAPALAVGPGTLADLARHAAALYAASGNFTVLHVVTACQALGVLQPWLPGAPEAWQPVVVAVAAALCASGLGSLQAPAPADDPAPWACTLARALESDDEHVIKLVQACRALQARLGGTVFQAAAARAVAPADAVSAATGP